MSLNDNEVNIYCKQPGTGDWILEDTLKGHDLRVTGIDWAVDTNRIVTCSAVSISIEDIDINTDRTRSVI